MKLVSRRTFCWTAGIGALTWKTLAQAQNRYAIEHVVMEWSYSSQKTYKDPFNELELDVAFTDPQGREERVPAFWAGGHVWRVRYAPHSTGRYSYRTICSDASNPELDGRSGSLEVSPYQGKNPLCIHGPVRVAADRRHFEHLDGTPFFWLGDTWWMGLCKRMRWPEDFQLLAADRLNKGFTVVQIVAGLYPDMPQFDSRGANEAGYPWEPDYARINPGYFDMADLRIQYLADRGLVPCIVGCWGYFLPLMGMEKMKQHWRNLVARWGAYPVVWCLAGEGSMPYYLSATKEQDAALQKRGWTEIGKYVHRMDPFHHPVTIHPSDAARNTVEDPSVLDFDMLQTGHGDRTSIPNTVNLVTGSLSRAPKMPVLVGEVCYEGIVEASRQEVQRFMFWASVLSGAAGHTYGANGIWQVNTREQPFGPSPHGRSWGDTPWEVAYQLPGSQQLGFAKALLMRYPWWRLEPHPEWMEPHWSKENYLQSYCAGIPGELRVAFLPATWDPPRLKQLENSVSYYAFYFNPASGKQYDLGKVTPDVNGTWQASNAPIFQDWVLVLEKR
ncbi:MAG: hypothetical protein DMG05_12440 [Acidobacteria bacterium]|nr:MAG: hypothetical protein DMG05_12440 [Acidobacteriota bacterium]